MLEHVYRRCALADGVDDLFVACCDEEVRQTVQGFGGTALMTPPEIDRPGLRVAEASRQLDLADDDVIVVVQGDEPLIHPGMIELAAARLLEDGEAPLGTLVAPANEDEWTDTNEVKCAASLDGRLLFMTRSAIPSNTRGRIGPRLKQVAVMPFRRRFLLEFQELEPTPLEITESVELLRALEHGVRTLAIHSPYESVSVDTEPDRQEAERAMRDDEIYPRYAR